MLAVRFKQLDPETEGPTLPTSEKEEFRPFTRRVPEFKFWYVSTPVATCARRLCDGSPRACRYSSSKATFIAFCMTFFNFFNIPVFWPILLLYFIALFFLTMKRQIKHMWKHNYVPWSAGKTKYAGKPDKEGK